VAQSDEAKVSGVLERMERAEQTGDFNAFAALWSREKQAEIEKMRTYMRAQPQRQYRAIKAYVQGEQGVMLAQAAANSYVTMMLRREEGQWRIRDMEWRETAPNPKSVYAVVPPDTGAFARDGSRWDQIAPALDADRAARLGFQMRALFDESFLYIRIETNGELPAPGSTIEKPPSGWPVLKIVASGAGEFVLYDAVDVGDQATFDEHGKANSHRAFAAYSLRLERNHEEVFTAWAGLDPTPLIGVAGRNLELRIPLATMGITDSRATRMTVGDAAWPKSTVVSVDARRYPH